MAKIVSFFIGLCILALMFGAIAGAAAIYDTTRQIKIQTYFFQPNNQSGERVGVPATPADLGRDKMRRLLVEKYLSEYFYVIPDAANVEMRMGANSPLARMSTSDVFAQWLDFEGEYIQELAGKGVFRTVRVVGDIEKPADSDFWTVKYEMKTWYKPNDMAAEPVVTRDVLYMGLVDENILDFRESLDVAQYLEDGYDPAAIFRFGVTAIGRQQEK